MAVGVTAFSCEFPGSSGALLLGACTGGRIFSNGKKSKTHPTGQGDIRYHLGDALCFSAASGPRIPSLAYDAACLNKRTQAPISGNIRFITLCRGTRPALGRAQHIARGDRIDSVHP